MRERGSKKRQRENTSLEQNDTKRYRSDIQPQPQSQPEQHGVMLGLPDEVSLHILSYLPLTTLNQIAFMT